MARSAVLAAVVLAASVAAGFGAAALMRANSPENDACIGCGLAVFAGIGVGVAVAIAILVNSGRRKQ